LYPGQTAPEPAAACCSTPLEVHDRARRLGMDLVTLTDHDTIEGAFPVVAVPILGLAVGVAASRVVLGLHWLSDVLVGALVGLLIGTSAWLVLLQQR
jgi:hypothetical protein